MRLSHAVLRECPDLEGRYHVLEKSKCPSQIKPICDNILNMVGGLGYSIGSYHTMTELDKKLMIDYWCEYDNMSIYMNSLRDWEEWFIKRATEPELIRRSRQFLVEKQYLIVDERVRQQAQEASDKFRSAVKGR